MSQLRKCMADRKPIIIVHYRKDCIMENYSKKEIVDFVCEFYAANGRKISRKKLNAIPEEKLVDSIKSNPELETLYTGYIERKRKIKTLHRGVAGVG